MKLRHLKTDRLNLRPYQFSDLDDLLEFATDENWARFLPVPQPYTHENAEKFIASRILLNPEEHLSWAIEFNHKMIGGLNLRHFNEHHTAEIGYSLSPQFWGRGIMTEAAKCIIHQAFSHDEKLVRIKAMADERNSASTRVMEKLGMQKEGVLRANRIHRGQSINEVWYGILRSEWASGM